MKKNIKIAFLVVIAIILIQSCGIRKCDGSRGTRVEMGTM